MCSNFLSRTAQLTVPTLMLTLVMAAVLTIPTMAQTTTRFIVVGDSRGSDNGVNSAILTEVAQAIIDEGADFVLFPGDLVTGSTTPSVLESQLMYWRTIMQPVYDAGIDVYPCRGNHEDDSKVAWDNVFSGAYALPPNGPSGEENTTFSFTLGNVFVVGLDQYVAIHRINQVWLDQQFTSNTQPHVFVFGHEPAFSVRHTDCLDDYPAERNTFWSSLVNESGCFYFAGHDHFYNHARVDDGDGDIANDVYQYVVGTAGAPPVPWDGLYDGNNGSWTPLPLYHEVQYGYLLVEVDDSRVSITWKHRTAPNVYEKVRYDCGEVTRDGTVDIDDVVLLICSVFLQGTEPVPYNSGNVDCIDGITMDDILYLISYIFAGGPDPCDADYNGVPDC